MYYNYDGVRGKNFPPDFYPQTTLYTETLALCYIFLCNFGRHAPGLEPIIVKVGEHLRHALPPLAPCAIPLWCDISKVLIQ